jgi:hypothetical protein
MIKLPETPAEVAALIGSNYASMLQSGEEPTADTKYVLSIHDLLSAFAELERESEDEAPGSTGEAAELKTVVADAIAVMCANGDLPGEFEDVADWVANGVMPKDKHQEFIDSLPADCDDKMFEQIDRWARLSFRQWKSGARGQTVMRGDAYESHIIWAALRWAKKNSLHEKDQIIADLEDMIVFKDAAISNLGVLIDELRASQPDNGQQHTPEIGQ